MNSGIYKIENKEGDLVPFQMNYAQFYIYAHYLKHPRLIVCKARQMGVSTYWLLFFLDQAIVEDHMKFGLMAQGLDEASTLKERIERAWDNLPDELKDFLGLKVVTRNTKEFALSNDSKIYIATSFRSGTLQGLHISEMGKISNKHPEKAKETKSGSMQAIRGGLPVIVESTAEGRHNMFYDMWTIATKHEGPRAPKDFLPVFLSWADDPDCRISMPQVIDKEAEKYFEEAEFEYEKWSGKPLKLTDQQKWWWVAQLREFDGDRGLMGQEYPCYPEEAFSATKDGTYYARIYREHVVKAGHLIEELYDPALPVDIAMDLGMNDTMVLSYFQTFMKEMRFIDEYHNTGEGLLHYVEQIRSTGYPIRAVWVPHDAMVKELGTGKSRFQILREMGVPVRLLPRTKSVIDDIEIVRQMIPFMWFDKKNTSYLQMAMENYSKAWDDRLGVFRDKPLHDTWSNPADSIRYACIASRRRILSGGGAEGKRSTKRTIASNVVDGLAL